MAAQAAAELRCLTAVRVEGLRPRRSGARRQRKLPLQLLLWSALLPTPARALPAGPVQQIGT